MFGRSALAAIIVDVMFAQRFWLPPTTMRCVLIISKNGPRKCNIEQFKSMQESGSTYGRLIMASEFNDIVASDKF